MTELCKDLTLTIRKERDPEGAGERVRIRLTNELEMQEVEICYPVTAIAEKTAQSARYFVREALVIAMRRVISEAFVAGLISDSPGSPGEWTNSKPDTTEPSSASSEIDLDLW